MLILLMVNHTLKKNLKKAKIVEVYVQNVEVIKKGACWLLSVIPYVCVYNG